MQTPSWYRLFALGMLVLMPIAARAQAPKPKVPANSAQSGIAGKWYPDGMNQGEPTLLVFKVAGAKLTGSVIRGADTTLIDDGTVDRNTISFSYKASVSMPGDRSIAMVGKVGAAQIAFTVKALVGPPLSAGNFAPTFTASRIPPVTELPSANHIQGPQPKLTEIATIPGERVITGLRMPNRRIIICYTDWDSLFAYDLVSKRSTPIAGDVSTGPAISPRGDRIAYQHETGVIWSVAINPATGAPIATPQRVTMSGGWAPKFSPDGNLIAFRRSVKSDKGEWQIELGVVPAMGGAERVLAHFDRNFEELLWSGDGKWIYVQESQQYPITARSIVRVPVNGGPAETFLSYAHPEAAKSTIDSSLAFFTTKSTYKNLVNYVTASGKWGTFTKPAFSGSNEDDFGPPEIIVNNDRPPLLQTVDLESGKVREVAVDAYRWRSGSELPRNLAWSPDTKKLAFETGADESHEFVVINADGTNLHRFPVRGDVALTSWSPDGVNLTYVADSSRTIRTLNATTGRSMLIGSVPANRFLYSSTVPSNGRPIWQPDGKALLTLTCSNINCWNKPGSRPNMKVVEFRLDGTSRVVRDLSAEFPSLFGAILISNSQAIVEFAEMLPAQVLGVPTVTRIMMVPLNGGAATPVTMPSLSADTWVRPVHAWSDNWLVSLIFGATNQAVGLQALAIGSGKTQVIRFPEGSTAVEPRMGPSRMFLSKSGRLVSLGKNQDEVTPVTSLPLDGTPSQIIAHAKRPIGTSNNGQVGSISGDGKWLAYFTYGTPTSQIYDVDLGPLFQLINKKN